jgi:TfoX/Sxy family transcriptional regulator of competence genes
MAFDERLAERIRAVIGSPPELAEKLMFGGIGFIIQGNMACGVNQDRLIVRVGPDAYEAALAKPHVQPFDMTGRPMRGWVMVEPAGLEAAEALEAWVEQGVGFALTLPPKG